MIVFECMSSKLLWSSIGVNLIRSSLTDLYSVNAGSSQTTKSQEEWKVFWHTHDERKIKLGYFNWWVRVKCDRYENMLGRFEDDRVNDNEKSLLEVCLEWNFLVTNTMFGHENFRMYRKEEWFSRAFRRVGIDTDYFVVFHAASGGNISEILLIC